MKSQEDYQLLAGIERLNKFEECCMNNGVGEEDFKWVAELAKEQLLCNYRSEVIISYRECNE